MTTLTEELDKFIKTCFPGAVGQKSIEEQISMAYWAGVAALKMRHDYIIDMKIEKGAEELVKINDEIEAAMYRLASPQNQQN